jgi:hypothetical protein
MRARTPSSLWLDWLTSLLLATVFLPSPLHASNLEDVARQLAHEIAATAGPGTFLLEFSNRSSLDDKQAIEVRRALEAELHFEGVEVGKTEPTVGVIHVVLSESLSQYVWTAETGIGTDARRVALVSLPRPQQGTQLAPVLPIILKTSFLFAQERPILDVALVEVAGGPRLLVLDDNGVVIYHQSAPGRWELESSLPIVHKRPFPRDLRGRLLRRLDHLFDVYLPGVFCRSTSAAPLALSCSDADDLSHDSAWPLTSEDSGVRAFFVGTRNFFTGSLSPAIGKISNVPSFYSAAAIPRPSYTLWAFAGVEGSVHLVDGMTDRAIRGANWGSDVAAVRSSCGVGAQLLVSESGNPQRDSLRAFEFPDRDPVAVSSAQEFDGQIVALWADTSGSSAAAILKRADTGWYEAYRVSISCSN